LELQAIKLLLPQLNHCNKMTRLQTVQNAHGFKYVWPSCEQYLAILTDTTRTMLSVQIHNS